MTPNIDTSDDAVIRTWLRAELGIEDAAIHRQARWRAGWLVIARDGSERRFVVRGERGGGVPMQFSLRHEMLFQGAVGSAGIPAPEVHGWIDELPAIVMDWVPGRPDLDTLSGEQRDGVMSRYMEALVELHRHPVAPFRDAGVEGARTAEESGTFGISRFESLWRRDKREPNPFLEFSLSWLSRNPVNTRGRMSAIVWDSGQFHQIDGRMEALLDFELGHIGDPMMDLGAPRMRDTILHFGDFDTLYATYEAAGGYPVDMDAVQLHHIAFTLTNELALRNSLNNPSPDSDFMTNLHWCTDTNLHALEAIAERLGLALDAPELPEPDESRAAVAHRQLVEMTKEIETDDDYIRYRLRVMFRLARHLQREDEIGRELTAHDLDELSPILGYRPESWRDGARALEAFVLADGGQHDEQLIRLMYRRELRRKCALGPDGSAMVERSRCQPFATPARR